MRESADTSGEALAKHQCRVWSGTGKKFLHNAEVALPDDVDTVKNCHEVADRYAFFTEFFKNFYNTDLLLGKRVSKQAVQSNWNIAAGASATACLACVSTWYEDFRKDLTGIDVPTLVMQGDADRILPIIASGLRIAKLIKRARLVVVKDGPHCITWTHAAEVNSELVNFLGKGLVKRATTDPKTEADA